MKHFKFVSFFVSAIALLGMFGAFMTKATPVQAASDDKNERLSSTTTRLFVWQLERDGITITRDDRLYLVVNGDTWDSIAKAYGMTVDKLKGANPQVKDASILFRSELLHIPTGDNEITPLFYMTTVLSTSK